MTEQTLGPETGDGVGVLERDSTELVRTVLDAMIDDVIVIDERGKVLLFNPAAERSFGYSADEVVGRNVKMLMRESDARGHDGYIDQYLKTGHAKIIGIGREVVALRKDGTTFPAELAISEVEIDDRRRFVGTLRDRTSAKAEAQQSDSQTADLAATLDAIGVSHMMIEFAPNGTVIGANDKFLDTMEYELSEVVGQHHKMFCEPRYAQSPEYGEFWDDLRSGEFQSGELMRITKSGKKVWLQAAYNPVMQDGEVIKILKNATDITDRVTAQKTIEAQSQALRELSTPVLRLWNGIVLMPLIGVIDTARAKQITETLLYAISENRADVAILDVVGVPIMDTSVAKHLLMTIDAATMLGSEIILTGISPESAQTLVTLGINFSGIRSQGTLSAGLAEAFKLTGRDQIINDSK